MQQAPDLTAQNLHTTMAGVPLSDGLIIEFYYENVKIETKDAALNGTTQTRLCVRKQPRGDRQTAATQYITEEEAMAKFPVEFQHFKDHGEMPTTGTPLQELPGISRSQISILLLNGVRSIEDLVAISEEMLNPLGLEVQRAKKTAMAWHQNRTQNVDLVELADRQARVETQLTDTLNRNKTLEEANRALQAQLAALQGVQGVTTQVGPVEMVNNESDDLEHDVDNMPDPMSSGPATGDIGDDLGNNDAGADPLADPLLDQVGA